MKRKLVVSGQMEHWGLVDLPGAARSPNSGSEVSSLESETLDNFEEEPKKKEEGRAEIETGHNPAR